MHAASVVFLLVFVVLSAVDGVYVHLWKLRLHARPVSWVEHVWHTGTAVLFVPILVTIFLAPTAGLLLWTGIGLVALTHAIEALDVGAERASRADLGGVSRGELAVHVVLVIARTLALGLSLAARPAAAWALDAPPTIGAHGPGIQALIGALLPGGLAVAALHVALAWRHRPASCCAAVAA